jgi:hypothetical protein
VHPSTFVLLAEPGEGEPKRMRLGSDGSVTYVSHTVEVVDPQTGARTFELNPMKRSDHFILKEIETNVFMIMSSDGLLRAFVSGVSQPQLKFHRNGNAISEDIAPFVGNLVEIDPVRGRRLSLTVTMRPGYEVAVWLRPLSLVRWLIDSDDMERGWKPPPRAPGAPGGPSLEQHWVNSKLCDGKTIGKFNVLRTRLACAEACEKDPKCKYAAQRRVAGIDVAVCRIKGDCGAGGLIDSAGWNTWVKPAPSPAAPGV